MQEKNVQGKKKQEKKVQGNKSQENRIQGKQVQEGKNQGIPKRENKRPESRAVKGVRPEQVKAICIDVDTKAFRGIPPDEQQQFLHTLRLLITNLEEESE